MKKQVPGHFANTGYKKRFVTSTSFLKIFKGIDSYGKLWTTTKTIYMQRDGNIKEKIVKKLY